MVVGKDGGDGVGAGAGALDSLKENIDCDYGDWEHQPPKRDQKLVLLRRQARGRLL